MSHPFLKYLFTAVLSSAVLCLDQATKIFVSSKIQLEEPYVLINGFFNIAYITNAGGAFGLFNSSPYGVRFVLFLLLPIVCVAFIFAMLKETENRLQVMALSFILGGAAGNFLDRVRLGYVVDFIDWHVKAFHWPTFNIADSFIVVGISILLFFYIQDIRLSKNKNEK